jgi:phosphoenolpyruvate carboxylase
MAWRDVGNERAHQQTSERGVAVGEVIDIRLARGDLRQQAQAIEARIAELAGVAGRHRVASEPEEAERAALEAIRDLFAAAAGASEVIAVARPLEDFQLLLGGLAGERIARTVVERE